MPLKRIFTKGEKAVYKIAQEVAEHLGVEAIAKVRIADAIEIANSGISNEEYSYAMKAHFDVLVIQNNLPFLAIEFDGAGHNTKKDHLKNRLCDFFELPLVRVNITHINSKNFEHSAVHFFIHQLFGVDEFLEIHRQEPYEIYDPSFYHSVPNERPWPFWYAPRWRGRLEKQFQHRLELFDDSRRDLYKFGLLHLGASEGVWVGNNEFRAFCGQAIDNDARVIGTDTLSIEVFGMSDLRRKHFLCLWPFVIGLAAGNMYENALAFLEGDRHGVMSSNELLQMLDGWTKRGFEPRLVLNLPRF